MLLDTEPYPEGCVARITVVNDNPEFLELVRDILEDDRYETTTIDGDQSQALEKIRTSKPDVLMIDLRMGADALHGWEIAQQVRRDADFDGLPMLVCSADTEALKELAPALGATRDVEVLKKPFGIDELCDTIDRLLASPVS